MNREGICNHDLFCYPDYERDSGQKGLWSLLIKFLIWASQFVIKTGVDDGIKETKSKIESKRH